MPNQPKTPARTFRIPDDMYERLTQAAKQRNETRTVFVIKAIEERLRTLGGDKQ